MDAQVYLYDESWQTWDRRCPYLRGWNSRYPLVLAYFRNKQEDIRNRNVAESQLFYGKIFISVFPTLYLRFHFARRVSVLERMGLKLHKYRFRKHLDYYFMYTCICIGSKRS